MALALAQSSTSCDVHATDCDAAQDLCDSESAKEVTLSTKLSVEQFLAELKAEVEHHRAQEALHAQQEVFHREQRALHAESLQVAQERLAAFEQATLAANELVERRREAAKPPKVDEEAATSRLTTMTDFVAYLIQGKAPEETFGPSSLAREVDQRFRTRLKALVGPRNVSAALRRFATAGRIHLIRKGKGPIEALYAKARKPSPA